MKLILQFLSVSSSVFWSARDVLHQLGVFGATIRLFVWDEDLISHAGFDSFLTTEQSHLSPS